MAAQAPIGATRPKAQGAQPCKDDQTLGTPTAAQPPTTTPPSTAAQPPTTTPPPTAAQTSTTAQTSTATPPPDSRVSPYRGDPFQSPGCAALKGRPNPGNTNHCASPTAVHSPTTAQPQPPQTPNGRVSPYRGDPLQSPGCAALKGRPNPGNTNHHTPLNHHANTNRRTTPNHHAPRPPPPHSHSPRVLRPQSGAPTPPESVTRRSVGALVISSSGRGVEA